MDSRILSAEHAKESGVDEQWEQSNEDWWDWYLSLAAGDGAPVELTEVAPPAPVALPSLEELREELATPFELAPEQAERFQAEGYLKVKGVLSAGALAAARAEVERLAAAGDGPGRSGFLSLDMMWQGDSEVLRLFALSPRLGRLAADLLGVADARIYHDNVLSKTPGCGRTPWHFDAHHFPIASKGIVTSWIPLQEIPAAMGPLAFAAGKDTWQLAEGVDFNAKDSSYDAGVAEAFKAAGVTVDDGPFDARGGLLPPRVVLPLRAGERDDAAAAGHGHDVLRRRREARRQPDDGLGRLREVPSGRPARRGDRHAAEPDRLALMAPGTPPALATGGGVAYWRERARALGERAVLSTDHDAPVDEVTATHRELLLPELAALLPLAPSGPDRTVLDLGCGIGRLTGDLAALAGRAIGVDPVRELLALAPTAPGVEYRELEDVGGPLPLADGEADVAFTCLVLGGIPGAAALAALGAELERVLAPCGIVVLAESVSDQDPAGHWTFRSVADYAAALPWAGLQEVARFDDAGDAVSVLAGRKPAT